MFTFTTRGINFIFDEPQHINLTNVVYKIETDRGGIYIGSTTTYLHSRCDCHCINKGKELKNIHFSICKNAKVSVLYQINDNNKHKLREIENYVLFQEISKILEKKGVVYEHNETIFQLSKHFDDIILNRNFDLNRKDLRYIIANPNCLNLRQYSKITI